MRMCVPVSQGDGGDGIRDKRGCTRHHTRKHTSGTCVPACDGESEEEEAGVGEWDDESSQTPVQQPVQRKRRAFCRTACGAEQANECLK